MENKLGELKKEFEEKFSLEQYDKETGFYSYSIVHSPIVVRDWIDQNFVPKSELADLKAENEKLREVVSQTANLLTNSILDSENLVAEARQEERARVKKAIESVLLKRLMDNSIDFISINATQLSEEFDKAITADQQGKTV